VTPDKGKVKEKLKKTNIISPVRVVKTNTRCTINAAGNIANLPSGVVVKLGERCM
jgi:hypothetical protein